ncbi:MAG: flagellar motor protein MotB [Bacteroidetes bacterium]|nr:flagellar motor protein MotB [Bacteroidota bacterium]MBU1719646.1 flagellar motor protein MotB [Bacteroidota bacterium]
MKTRVIVWTAIFVIALTLVSCVSKKKFVALKKDKELVEASLNTLLQEMSYKLNAAEKKLIAYSQSQLICENDLAHALNRIRSLEAEIEYLRATNSDVLDVMSDLSVVSKSGAQNIKKSLEALNEQNKYIMDLTSSIRRKDSLNLVLVMNLKRSLSDVKDEDITIEVKKGVVYISLSDKMLFKSGSAVIQPEAEVVLAKIAKVVNDHKNLDILVEGHTDNVPIKTDCMIDNWDLSVKRATAVTRLLQAKYNVQPGRMTAGGRGEWVPKAINDSDKNKSLNRRTEIIILPKLDEFFQLLEPPAGK